MEVKSNVAAMAISHKRMLRDDWRINSFMDSNVRKFGVERKRYVITILIGAEIFR